MGRYDDMELNKPFRSKAKGKKYSIIIMDKGKRRIIHFGGLGSAQFKDKVGLYSSLDNNDPKRRTAFYDRFGGKSTDKTSPLYYSQKYLWWRK